jgi:hypothetical protein
MANKLKQRFVIDISTWAGISLGGEHFYGKLKWTNDEGKLQSVDLEHPLSRREATYLSKKSEAYGKGMYKAGMMDNRFETREELIRYAIKKFKELRKTPQAILINSSYSNCSARPLLAWPKGFSKQAKRCNDLAEEWEKIDGYEGNYNRADAIDDEWNKILEPFN